MSRNLFLFLTGFVILSCGVFALRQSSATPPDGYFSFDRDQYSEYRAYAELDSLVVTRSEWKTFSEEERLKFAICHDIARLIKSSKSEAYCQIKLGFPNLAGKDPKLIRETSKENSRPIKNCLIFNPSSEDLFIRGVGANKDDSYILRSGDYIIVSSDSGFTIERGEKKRGASRVIIEMLKSRS